MVQTDIAFRCVASVKKGFGNFNRSVILAEGLREKKHQILFLIDNEPKLIHELIKRKFQFSIIPKLRTTNNESLHIIDILKMKNIDFLILDSRDKGELMSQKISVTNIQIILLDDAWVNETWADITINGTMIKQYQKYKKPRKNSKIYVGTKYFLINKNFLKNKKFIKDIKEKNKYNIVISMGGSDLHGLTSKILDSLSLLENIHIQVILGPLMKKSIHKHQYDQKSITFVESSTTIWKTFKKADLVISNAGNTLFELATQRVPTICIPVIDHQIPYAEFFHKNGFAVNLGFWKNIKNKDIKNIVIKLLKNTAKRKKMSSKGNEIIDGKGLFNVIQIIESFIKKTNLEKTNLEKTNLEKIIYSN